MIGKNKIVLNQAEMCRLLSLALLSDTMKDQKIKVKEVRIPNTSSQSSYAKMPDEFEVEVEGESTDAEAKI